MLLQLQTPSANQLTDLLTQIDLLSATVRPVLVPVAQSWARPIIVGTLIFWLAKWAFDFLAGDRVATVITEAILFLGKVLGVSVMLQFYNTPFPGFGVPWPDIIPQIAKEIAGIISVASIDTVLTQINGVLAGMAHPPAWNFFQLVVYFAVLALMALLDAALLIVTGLGFWALGLGRIFGPIPIVLWIIPVVGQRFYAWINFMWVYSWYRAVAAAVSFVAATFMVNFFNNTVAGDYTIDHFASMLAFMTVNIVLCAVAVMKTPSWTVELFGNGLGHTGGGAGEAIRNLVVMAAKV